MLGRYGGKVVYSERRDSGGMFNDTLGVEELPAEVNTPNKFRAFASGSWGGGVQCFRPTLEEAKAELNRLYDKMHNGYPEN